MKQRKRFDLSSPKVQISMGILWGVSACALKSYMNIAWNESIVDVVLIQSLVLAFMCALEFGMALVCKFEDFRDEGERILLCGVFGVGAATLALGLMLEFPTFMYVCFISALPWALMFGNKFYFKYYTLTMVIMSLFVVAWQ